MPVTSFSVAICQFLTREEEACASAKKDFLGFPPEQRLKVAEEELRQWLESQKNPCSYEGPAMYFMTSGCPRPARRCQSEVETASEPRERVGG